MTVYFDLDRVLADFAAQAERYDILKRNGRINWLKMLLIGSRFWSEMDLFPGAASAFSAISEHCMPNGIRVKVLSSVRTFSGKRGKREWCKKKLNLVGNDVIIVRNAGQKASFAADDALLIDDSRENVDNFISNGGHALRFSEWNEETLDAVIKLIGRIKNERSSFDIK